MTIGELVALAGGRQDCQGAGGGLPAALSRPRATPARLLRAWPARDTRLLDPKRPQGAVASQEGEAVGARIVRAAAPAPAPEASGAPWRP
jgi:hypothetical protein